MKLSDAFKLIFAICVAELAGLVGSIFTIPAIQSGWYGVLVKPALNPPNWVFGPVWITLYALIGVSFFLVWRRHSLIRPSRHTIHAWRIGVVVFSAQLFLNMFWSIIFFGLRNPGLALADIILLWATIVWTIAAFREISKFAAYLLAPYIIWVSFAVYLNYSIWLLN